MLAAQRLPHQALGKIVNRLLFKEPILVRTDSRYFPIVKVLQDRTQLALITCVCKDPALERKTERTDELVEDLRCCQYLNHEDIISKNFA